MVSEHATGAARVLAEAKPDYVRLRTLEIFPGTESRIAMQKGEFIEASEEQVVGRLESLLSRLMPMLKS